MNYHETLIQARAAFQIKKEVEDSEYFSMLYGFVEAIIHLTQQVDEIKEKASIKKEFKIYEVQWAEMMEELCEYLEELTQQSFKVVQSKRMYEAMDETIADLEDWIENVNELLGEEIFSYIEAWDIGVFF